MNCSPSSTAGRSPSGRPVTTGEERWTEARTLLTDGPSPEAVARLRRRRRLLWMVLVALVVLGIAAGLVVGFLAPDHRSTHRDDGDVVLSLALYALGLVLEVTGL